MYNVLLYTSGSVERPSHPKQRTRNPLTTGQRPGADLLFEAKTTA